MSKSICCLGLSICLAVCQGASYAGPVTEVVILHPVSDFVCFGDSLSDVGNVWTATGQAFPPAAYGYYQGRCTNGTVWIEQVATTYGIPLPEHSLGGGKNQAWAGARSGTGTSELSLVPGSAVWNLRKQVAEYIDGGGGFGPTTLVPLWISGNDLFDLADPVGVAQNAAAAVSDLVDAGAREFLVVNQVPLGETPLARSQGAAAQSLLNDLSAGFNTALAAELAVWDSDPDVTVHQLDAHALFVDIFADPAAYGFQNVEDSAINFPAADHDEYVFWDDFHPTTAGHAAIAGQIRIVPEPGTLALLALGGLTLGSWLVRRRLVRERV